MRRKVLIIDTSILTIWLQVPGFETAGVKNEWNLEKVLAKLKTEQESNTCFVLPIATIIETGNHIAHIKQGDVYGLVNRFADLLEMVARNRTPWTLFTTQAELWTPEHLIELAAQWRSTGAMKLALGDASIVKVAHYYQQMQYEVEIFTGDALLKSYENASFDAIIIPRRRRK